MLEMAKEKKVFEFLFSTTDLNFDPKRVEVRDALNRLESERKKYSASAWRKMIFKRYVKQHAERIWKLASLHVRL